MESGPSPLRRPDPPGGARARRTRAVAAAALVAVLAGGWVPAARRGSSGDLGPPPATVTMTSTGPAPSSVAPAPTTVRRTIDGITIETAALDAAGAARVTDPVAGEETGTGTPACASGLPDVRAWSRRAQPDRIVGRYRCTFEHGRAAMWWTDGDRLFHATAPGADLAGLFAWWRAHPAE